MADLRQKLWAVGGGKGGVGKSVVTLMLAAWLGRLGSRVIVVDADLGGANLHTMLGIRYPTPTLDDFLNRRVENLDQVALETALTGVRLISGADDILGLANPQWGQKMRLLRHLQSLEADFVLLDLGAGTGFNCLDFFTYAGGRIAVFAPQAPSVQNAYGYIKSSLFRRLNQLFGRSPEMGHLVQGLIDPGGRGQDQERFDSVLALKSRLKQVSPEAYERLCEELASWRVHLVANMVRNKQGQETAKVLRNVALSYLDLELNYLGSISYDPEIERHVNKLLPLLQGGAASQAALCSYAIANEMLKTSRLARAS
jgi:flagellar biosynthesis protein FlhG